MAGFLNNKVTTTNNVEPLDGVNLFCIFKENLSVNSFLANYKNTTVKGKIRFFAKGMAVIVLFGFLLGVYLPCSMHVLKLPVWTSKGCSK